MTLNERLQEAFDKRVFGTAMTSASDLLSAMTAIEQAEAENAALKEQVAQLESLVSRYSKGMRENLAEALKGQETIAQQAEAIRMKDEALSLAMIGLDESWEELNEDRVEGMRKDLAIQPSPEILQARDERVAEACMNAVKQLNETRYNNECDRSVTWECAIQISSGEWRKYI